MFEAVFPPRCIHCGAPVDTEFGLCADCWSETAFASGAVCHACGVSLPGSDDGARLLCDDCLAHPRPWDHGRSVMRYSGTGRELILALKHADRLDLVRPMAKWLARAAQPLLSPTTLIAPIPLHRWRLVKRRYNQAALLAQGLANEVRLPVCVDLFIRLRPTPSQKGRDRATRIANLKDAIGVHPARRSILCGRDLLIVDDVMTSGATLEAATRAARDAGANRVCILTLARVAKAL